MTDPAKIIGRMTRAGYRPDEIERMRRRLGLRPTDPRPRLLFRQQYSPGDTLVMAMAIRSIHLAFPGEYLTGVSGTCCSQLFAGNPDVVPMRPDEAKVMEFVYEVSWTRRRHFAEALCERYSLQLGRTFHLAVDRPPLYLTDDEKSWTPPWTNYVCLNAGYKPGRPTKWAGTDIYQEVADWLVDHGLVVVQIGSVEHVHPRLSGAVDYIGHTNVRELLRLAYHSVMGVGPLSFCQHVFAGVERPYVSVQGGCEEPEFTAYPLQRTLNTVGTMDCCRGGGCWRYHLPGDVDTKTGRPYQDRLCALPVIQPNGDRIAECYRRIGADAIIAACQDIIGGE